MTLPSISYGPPATMPPSLPVSSLNYKLTPRQVDNIYWEYSPQAYAVHSTGLRGLFAGIGGAAILMAINGWKDSAHLADKLGTETLKRLSYGVVLGWGLAMFAEPLFTALSRILPSKPEESQHPDASSDGKITIRYLLNPSSGQEHNQSNGVNHSSVLPSSSLRFVYPSSQQNPTSYGR